MKQTIYKLPLLLVLLFIGFNAYAQQPTRKWDGKYYYADDFMDGWVVMEVRGKIDTINGYVKQYIPYDDEKSCSQVIFKKRKSDGNTKYKPDDVFAYYRYDELYERFKLPNGKYKFRKKVAGGRINVYSYYGKVMKVAVDLSLSISGDKEFVEHNYIEKDGKIQLIDWENPYVHTELKVWFADCPDLDTSAFKEGMKMEQLMAAVERYNKFCK